MIRSGIGVVGREEAGGGRWVGEREKLGLQHAEHSPIYNVIKKQNPFPQTAGSSQLEASGFGNLL